MSIISPLAEYLSLQVISSHVPVTYNITYDSNFGMGENFYPSKTYSFEHVQVGLWTIRIILDNQITWQKSDQPDFFLLTSNQSPYRLSSEQITYETLVGKDIGIVAHLYHESAVGVPIKSAALLVDVDVRFPNGNEEIITMHDDGLHNDGQANDGIYGAVFNALEEGQYITQIVLRGHDIIRTTQNIVAVVKSVLNLTQDTFITDGDDEEMVTINLVARIQDKSIIGTKFKIYSQVWADDKPIAWISGMSVAEPLTDTTIALPLQISLKWIQRAEARLDALLLRNSYVQDVDTSIPLSQLRESNIAVIRSAFNITKYTIKFDGTITEKMLLGARPTFIKPKSSNTGHKVMLVHGYCTNDVPFPSTDFTDSVRFEDFNKGRSNDEFAQLIAALGESLDSFSVVAHS